MPEDEQIDVDSCLNWLFDIDQDKKKKMEGAMLEMVMELLEKFDELPEWFMVDDVELIPNQDRGYDD